MASLAPCALAVLHVCLVMFGFWPATDTLAACLTYCPGRSGLRCPSNHAYLNPRNRKGVPAARQR